MEQKNGYKNWIIGLVLYFIFSRLLFYLIGIRFDASPLSWFYQFLDPVDLKNDLFRSILYLHIQPPLFNLFVGLIINLTNNSDIVFHTVYLLCGLIMTILLFKLQIFLGISPFISFLLSLLFASSPPVILYENWLFYEYPVAFLLLISCYFLYHFIINRKTINLILFFSSISLIVLTRTIFHIIWFIAIKILLLAIFQKNLKKILISCFLPFILIFIFYFKNYLIFGQFSLNSWAGMNLIKMTWAVPTDQINKLVEDKKISEIASILPFGKPEDYQKYANFDTITNIAVLDKKFKETGIPNFNHIGYIKVSKEYYKAAKYLIAKYPQYYLISVAKAFYAYLKPCSDSTIIKGNNRSVINPYLHFYEYYLLGGFLIKFWHRIYTNQFGKNDIIYINLLYIYLPIIYLWGFLLLFKGKTLLKIAEPQKIILFLIIFNILYVTIVGNLTETGENMRFRFLLLPYTYILLGTLAQKIFNQHA